MHEDINDANNLHIRIGSELQCMEIKAVMRARGILYTHVHHVLIIAIKDKERASNQRDLMHFWNRLRAETVRGITDASFFMDKEYQLFPDDVVVNQIKARHSAVARNKVLRDKVFEANAETRDVTIACLQAHCQSIVDQIDSNSADYLPGGWIFELFMCGVPTQAQALKITQFLKVPLTSDPMERMFSHFNHDMDSQRNLKLATGAGMTCCRENRIIPWYYKLPPLQQTLIVDMMRRLFHKTVTQVDGQYTDAQEQYHQGQLRKGVAAAKKRDGLISSMVKILDVVVILKVADWEAKLTELRELTPVGTERDKTHLSMIKAQCSALRYRCGVRYGLLPRYTRAKENYTIHHINTAYTARAVVVVVGN